MAVPDISELQTHLSSHHSRLIRAMTKHIEQKKGCTEQA